MENAFREIEVPIYVVDERSITTVCSWRGGIWGERPVIFASIHCAGCVRKPSSVSTSSIAVYDGDYEHIGMAEQFWIKPCLRLSIKSVFLQ